MPIEDIKSDIAEKMRKSIAVFKSSLTKIRTGRAHIGFLDHLMVNYYETNTPLQEVANITLADARTIVVQPWVKKMVAPIEKVIRDSNLGLNPSVQGDIIRVPMPVLTQERRLSLVKLVKGEGESAKMTIRNLRREANDQVQKLLKQKQISEDDQRRSEKDMQKTTDQFITLIDSLVEKKEEEIRAI